MAIPYVAPGIIVTETDQTAVTAQLAALQNVGLVGMSSGSIQVTDLITFADGPGGTLSVPAIPTATEDLLGTLPVGNYFYSVAAVAPGDTWNGTSGTRLETTATELAAHAVVPSPSGRVILTWTAVPSAYKYRVYRSPVGGSTGSENTYFEVFTTVFIDTGAITGTTGTSSVSNTATLPTQVAVLLPTLAQNPGATLGTVQSVYSATNPAHTATAPYNLTTDYTVVAVDSIERTSGSAIGQTDSVYVSYTYTPANYFQPTLFTDLGGIQQTYGSAFTPDGGSINSPVSFAALCAFGAGARQVYIVPLFTLTDPTNPDSVRLQPTYSQSTVASISWAQTYNALVDQTDIDLIVPVSGQDNNLLNNTAMLNILEATQDFVNNQQTADQIYVEVIAGEDGTAATVGSSSYPDKSTMRVHAASLQARYSNAMSQSFSLINSVQFPFSFPISNTTKQVGGQYVAAAIAGLVNSTAVSATVNKATVPGFLGIVDSPKRSKTDLQADAQAGLLVLTQPRNTQSVQIRHAITLDSTSSARRELSVVRSKFYMLTSILQTLNGQVIGKTVPPGTDPVVYVEAAVTAVLEALKGAGDILSYDSVTGSVITNNPTTVGIQFNYTPNFPINYIQLSFSVNLSSGSATITTG
jgi:hypothetical protein